MLLIYIIVCMLFVQARLILTRVSMRNGVQVLSQTPETVGVAKSAAARRIDLNAVSAISDRTQILVKGQTVCDGPSAELRASPELHIRYLGV